MSEDGHPASAATGEAAAEMSDSVSCRKESRAGLHAEHFGGGGQVDVPRLAGLHGIDKRDVDGRGQSHVLRDVHALAAAPPCAHLLATHSKGLGRLAFVLPPIEPESGFEQRHRSKAPLPACFLSFSRARVLGRVGDGAGVGDNGSLQVLERDSQKRSDPHNLMERRSRAAAALPRLDRRRADAEDLPQLRTRIAGRLPALLQESAKRCLLESHRRIGCGSTVIAAYASDPLDFVRRRSTEAIDR
jgi:hypothetical protein